MKLYADIPPEVEKEIERQIASDASPVGIDAKKTHVLILHRLMEIERRLAALEARFGPGDPGRDR